MFEKEELEAIAKKEEFNNKMEEHFNNQRDIYKSEIHPLLEISKLQYNAQNAQSIVDIQASALSMRQRINEEMTFYLQKLTIERKKYKLAVREKTIWYAAGQSKYNFSSKLSTGQLTNIIDGHTAESSRTCELFEAHIDFLRNSAKNLLDLGYQVKNTIELYNLLLKN